MKRTAAATLVRRLGRGDERSPLAFKTSELRVSDAVERWTVARLVDLVPGSSRRTWLTELVPELVGARVLRKVGKGWLGRKGAIEAALLSPSGPPPAR